MIEIPVEGIATDAAHSTKNKITEFQGIDLRTGKRIFYQNLGNKQKNSIQEEMQRTSESRDIS